jgi:hypothetical protein
MGKKRLVIDLTDAEHDSLVRTSRKLDLTLSNYVRRALSIPLRTQGIKHPEAPPTSKGVRRSKSAR